jgi:hypothetical protein
VSEEAVMKFYNHYKNLHRILDQNQFTHTAQSTFTAILKKSSEVKTLPCKMGIVKYRGNQDRVDVRNFAYGDKYIEVLSEGVQRNQISSYNLTGNRITGKSMDFQCNL